MVATDFSPAATNALRYALSMAKALQAKLVLFHAFQSATAVSLDASLLLTQDEMKNVVNQLLQQQVETVRQQDDPAVEIRGEEGGADLILQTAMACKADAIVMGMKKDHDLAQAVFGSTVTQLYHKITIPLLVIPEQAGYMPVTKMVLASDIMPEPGSHTLDLLQEIAQHFSAKVFIVRVASNRFEEVYELLDRPEKFGRLRKIVDVQYEYRKNKRVVKTLNDFVEDRGINMMVMVPHRHSLMDKWFFKSITRSMIWHTVVPVLVLPERWQ